VPSLPIVEDLNVIEAVELRVGGLPDLFHAALTDEGGNVNFGMCPRDRIKPTIPDTWVR